ncbi:phosphatidate cytidylyltransferase [Thermovibrio ammonificans]
MRERLLGALLVVLYASLMVFGPSTLFYVLVYLLGVVAVIELFQMAELEEFSPLGILLFSLLFLFAVNIEKAVALLSYYFSTFAVLFHTSTLFYKLLLSVPAIFGTLLLAAFALYGMKLPRNFFPVLYFLVYLSFGFVSIALLPKHLFLLLIALVWSTDTFAYLVGRYFGRRKLVPSLSPKKTVEGALGGSLFGTLFSFLVVLKFGILEPGITALFILFFLTVVSQLGDLLESALKRLFGVKDSGSTIPGHGGVLDRLDSAVAVAPLLLLLGGV